MSVLSHISPVGDEARIEFREEVAPRLSLEGSVVSLPWVAGKRSGRARSSVESSALNIAVYSHFLTGEPT